MRSTEGDMEHRKRKTRNWNLVNLPALGHVKWESETEHANG